MGLIGGWIGMGLGDGMELERKEGVGVTKTGIFCCMVKHKISIRMTSKL